ncbi:ATP-binding protein, partial [Caldisericum sp.]|uniref:ATP-binding protein n=1 Tax=Caldisericum sp. TaxID=2499687 RepID=UPI003D0E6D67
QMKFFDREYELKEAKELEKPRSRLLVLYGRRRIGKTALIKELFKNSNAKTLYLFIPKNTKINIAMEGFEEEVRRALNLKEYEKIDNFAELLNILFDKSKQEKIIVAFDEFQNFIYFYPGAVDILQREWDLRQDSSNLSIIISGSTIGLIKKMFVEHGAPLFKRAYNMVELKELDLGKSFELMSSLGIKEFEDRLRAYFMFGGVIFYYSLIDYYGLHTFNDIIERLLISPVAPLKDIVKMDLIEAFGNGSPTYFAILEAIANGKNTNNEVAAYAQIKETSLPAYLYDLQEMLGIIETVTIPTVVPKKGSKKNWLAITDNFYKFWFNIIGANYDLYEANDMDRLRQKIYARLPLFEGKAFEEFAQKFIKYIEKSLFPVERIGRWFGKDPSKQKGMNEEEIDVVALNEKSKDILFAECKWSNEKVGVELYEELKRKSKLVQWHNNERHEHYALFSKSGFTEEMKRIAEKERVLLFDLEAIEKALNRQHEQGE